MTDLQYADVNGIKFALRRADPPTPSSEPAAVLLHGVPQHSLMWEPLIAELAHDRTVIAPDLKGMGSSGVRGPYDIPTLIRELVELIRDQVQTPIDVVGHDWGGALAIALARSPARIVRRLVVVNAPYRKVNYARSSYMGFFALPFAPELLFRIGGRRLLGAMLQVSRRVPLDDETISAYAVPYEDPARVQAMLAYYRWVVRRRLTGQLSRHEPTGSQTVDVERSLVLWGTADSVLPPSVGDATVRDLDATQYVTVPSAGHWVIDDAPEVAVPAIAAFLRRGDAILPSDVVL